MALVFPVAEGSPIVRNLELGGRVEGLVRDGVARLQPGQSNQRLDGGAGCVLPLDGAVEQRVLCVPDQVLVVVGINAVPEHVRVKTGRTDQCQNIAG